MNLKQIRTQFVKLSGRYDLVVDTTDYLDNGADTFIRSGLKMLDRRMGFDKSYGILTKQFAIGDYFLDFLRYRSVEYVWFVTSSGRWQLTYLTPLEMQSLYGTEAYGDVDNGTATYYTTPILREMPAATAPDVIGNYNEWMTADGTQLTKAGVMIMPPTDTAGHVEIWGKFTTEMPTTETGTNYWFEQEDLLAVWAALYQLEVSYRNTEGAKGWMASIMDALSEIDKDTIEDDVSRSEEMDG